MRVRMTIIIAALIWIPCSMAYWILRGVAIGFASGVNDAVGYMLEDLETAAEAWKGRVKR